MIAAALGIALVVIGLGLIVAESDQLHPDDRATFKVILIALSCVTIIAFIWATGV